MKILLILILPLLCAPGVFASDILKSIDASEVAKRQTERERQFLLRSVEDLNKSHEHVQAMVRVLEKQIEAIDILEPSGREQDITAFLEWYRAYAEWLGTIRADIETDLAHAYSNGQGPFVQPDRYYSLSDGYSRLGTQLDDELSRLDKLNKIVLQRMADVRSVLLYVTSADFIDERNRERKQSQPGNDRAADRARERRNNEMYQRYKDITDLQIAIMEQDFKNLDELQKHFLLLLEMGNMERSWIDRKTGDYEALCPLAALVSRDIPESIEDASNGVIKRYESDIAYYKRKIEEISRDKSRIVPSGSMKTLDRLDELSDMYDWMKNRYDRHRTWLAEQTGAYRADISQLRKNR